MNQSCRVVMTRFALWMFVVLTLSTPLAAQRFANDIVQEKRERNQDPNATPATDVIPDDLSADDPNPPATTREQVVASIVEELDALIPGDYPPESEGARLLSDIANRFVDGDGPGVEQALDRLEELDLSVPPRELLIAGVNFVLNNPQAGQQFLERAAAENLDHPAIPMAYCRLAIAQGRFGDALAQVERTERLLAARDDMPAAVRRHYQLQVLETKTVIAMRQGRYQDALEYAQQWERANPTDPKALISRAEIEFHLGNIEKSKEYITKFRAVTPNSHPTELILARWFQSKGDAEGTAEWIGRAAEMYPDNNTVQLEYANWALGREDFATASQALLAIENRAGESPTTQLMKARIAFAQGAFEIAEALFEKLYVSQPGSFDVANMYALTLLESGEAAKRARGLQIAQRNVQSLSDSPVAQAAFGWALFKNGDAGNAKNVFARLARMRQMAPEVAYFLATILEQDGNAEQAKAVLEPALKHEGLFLYRRQAQTLMDKIQSTTGLPDPGK